MTNGTTFKGHSIVSCGTLRRELRHLQENGFLDVDRLLFTAPGLHENLDELQKQLTGRIQKARKHSQKVIVVYGDTCYLPRDIDELLDTEDDGISRVEASHCIDMLASVEERDRIAAGKKIYWLPPGWFEYKKAVFKNWDVGMANETFPQHHKAVLLDPLGVFDEYLQTSPEEILGFSDWMGIPFEPYRITLSRLKALLSDCVRKDQ